MLPNRYAYAVLVDGAPGLPAEYQPQTGLTPWLETRPSQGPGPEPESLGKGMEVHPVGLRQAVPASQGALTVDLEEGVQLPRTTSSGANWGPPG